MADSFPSDCSSLSDRAEVLRGLHTAPELLVLVNVWDAASAATVAAAPGCRAVATASAAIAAAHGYPDGEVIPVELMLAAVGRIATAVELPVTADLESGYGDVDATVRRAVQLGVVGANLEDAMRPLPEAVTMVGQAVRAALAEGVPLVLNARTDCFLDESDRPQPERLADALQRGRAFLDEGADCVFVPGCVDEETIAALVEHFGPGRLSLLALPGLPPNDHLERLGVARVSYGPAPHRRALSALAQLASSLLATSSTG